MNSITGTFPIEVRITEINGIPVDFLDALEDFKTGNVTEMFNEDDKLNE